MIRGATRKPNYGEKFGALIFVKEINGESPEKAVRRKDFDSLTPVFPNERISLEKSPIDLSTRVIDLV